MRISDWSSDVCSSDLWKGALANPSRSHDGGGQSMPLKQPLETPVEVQVRKPGGHAGH